MSNLNKIERTRNKYKIIKYRQMIYQCEQNIEATKRKLRCQELQLREYEERLKVENFNEKLNDIKLKQSIDKQMSIDTLNEIMVKETMIQSMKSNVDETKSEILQRKLMTTKGDYKDQRDFDSKFETNRSISIPYNNKSKKRGNKQFKLMDKQKALKKRKLSHYKHKFNNKDEDDDEYNGIDENGMERRSTEPLSEVTDRLFRAPTDSVDILHKTGSDDYIPSNDDEDEDPEEYNYFSDCQTDTYSDSD